MEQKNIQLKNDVLQRVKSIYYMRTVARPKLVKLLVKSGLFLLTIAATSFLVSVPNVLKNLSTMPDISAYPTFLFHAFIQTQFIVQIVLLAAFFLLGLLLIDIAKNFKYFHIRQLQA